MAYAGLEHVLKYHAEACIITSFVLVCRMCGEERKFDFFL